MLDLIRELAVFERAPDEVTVSLHHFEESGFGERPYWWAFVACIPDRNAEQTTTGISNARACLVQEPLLAEIMEDNPEQDEEQELGDSQNCLVSSVRRAKVQLSDAYTSVLQEELPAVQSASQHAAASCKKLIGLALYYIRYSTWKGQRMFLEDMIVTESWRRKGVGTALMDALVGEAKAARLHGITCQILSWNDTAIKFYQRYGAHFDKKWMNAAINV